MGGLKSRTDESTIIVIRWLEQERVKCRREIEYATPDKRCQIDELEVGTVGLGLPSSRRSG